MSKKYWYRSYFDGHYVDSGLPPEERERRDKEAQEKNAKLKDWSEADC
ncbi:MAG: hypothetical protein LIO62_02920 [Clostridiales bacterium]|nr:hypothetical protein [Clostridiales bacterium]